MSSIFAARVASKSIRPAKSAVPEGPILLPLILLVDPVLVGTGGDVLHPVLVVEIPLDGFADAGLEGLGGFPAQVAVDLSGIDGVAAVVTGTIGDVGDLLFVALAIGARR